MGEDIAIKRSVWRDAETLQGLVYCGDHVGMMRRRGGWFKKMELIAAEGGLIDTHAARVVTYTPRKAARVAAFFVSQATEDAMLSDAKLQAIIWTADMVAAEHFYRDVLGLSLRGRSHGALVFDVGGCDLRVSPVQATRPSEHTVLGFEVAGVDAVIACLTARSVPMERFAGFPHGENGVLLTPEGARVAWFRDPDGNLLSIVQYR